MYYVGTTSILFEVYLDTNNNLAKITSQTLNFTAKPSISVSSQLTKILIYGVNSTALNAYLYFVNYTLSSVQTLSFPS